MSDTIRLNVEVARALADTLPGGTVDEWTVVENELTGTARWSLEYRLTIHNNDFDYYQTVYRKPATEMQEEEPFEWTEPVFRRVFPREVTVTVYEPASKEAV